MYNLSTTQPFSKILITILVTFILGIIAALSFRHLKYTPFIRPNIVEIAPKTAYQNLQDKKNVVFIDVRSEYEYDQAHASGSVNLPIHYMYDDTHDLKNEKGVDLPKNTDTEIYLICTGGRLAGVAYSYLEHYGYRNIKRIEGGINNWNSQGYPIVTKPLFNNIIPQKSTEINQTPLDKPYANKTNN